MNIMKLNFKLGLASLVTVGMLVGCTGDKEVGKETEKNVEENVEEVKEEVDKEVSEVKTNRDIADLDNYVQVKVLDKISIGDSIDSVIESIDLENIDKFIYENEDSSGNKIKGISLLTEKYDKQVNVYLGLEDDKVSYISENVFVENKEVAEKLLSELKSVHEKEHGKYLYFIERIDENNNDEYSKAYEWETESGGLLNLRLGHLEDEGLVITIGKFLPEKDTK